MGERLLAYAVIGITWWMLTFMFSRISRISERVEWNRGAVEVLLDEFEEAEIDSNARRYHEPITEPSN